MLAARTGLHFPQERWGDLEKGIAAAAPMFGMPDAPSCARWLLDAPLRRNQIEVRAAHLTVGETYQQPVGDCRAIDLARSLSGFGGRGENSAV